MCVCVQMSNSNTPSTTRADALACNQSTRCSEIPNCSTPSNLEVKASSIHGVGLFATAKIPNRTTIGTYLGDQLTAAKLEELYPGDTIAHFVLRSANDPDFILDAWHPSKGNYTRYINSSSSEPNAKFKDVYQRGRGRKGHAVSMIIKKRKQVKTCLKKQGTVWFQ